MFYALHTICFNGMSISIFMKVQRKLHLILSVHFYQRYIHTYIHTYVCVLTYIRLIAIIIPYFQPKNKIQSLCVVCTYIRIRNVVDEDKKFDLLRRMQK